MSRSQCHFLCANLATNKFILHRNNINKYGQLDKKQHKLQGRWQRRWGDGFLYEWSALRKLVFDFLSNWMRYDRGDSFPFNSEPNGNPFGSKSKGKLSPRSYLIRCERKWKYWFLSVPYHDRLRYFYTIMFTHSKWTPQNVVIDLCFWLLRAKHYVLLTYYTIYVLSLY